MNPSDSEEREEARSTIDDKLFTIWKEYEQIAVHFNDLILKLRVQALGGVAAISAIAALVLRETVDQSFRWQALTAMFGILIIFWIALFILDLFYYNRLLLGAVDAILEIEEKSDQKIILNKIEFSTKIRATVEGTGRKWIRSLKGPLWFYGLVLAGLVALFFLSASQICSTGVEPRIK
jgi:hypothetical protein